MEQMNQRQPPALAWRYCWTTYKHGTENVLKSCTVAFCLSVPISVKCFVYGNVRLFFILLDRPDSRSPLSIFVLCETRKSNDLLKHLDRSWILNVRRGFVSFSAETLFGLKLGQHKLCLNLVARFYNSFGIVLVTGWYLPGVS